MFKRFFDVSTFQRFNVFNISTCRYNNCSTFQRFNAFNMSMFQHSLMSCAFSTCLRFNVFISSIFQRLSFPYSMRSECFNVSTLQRSNVSAFQRFQHLNVFNIEEVKFNHYPVTGRGCVCQRAKDSDIFQKHPGDFRNATKKKHVDNGNNKTTKQTHFSLSSMATPQ